jgi:hypothetical protein
VHRSDAVTINEDLKDLTKLSADELALRLRYHFAAVGGLACAGEVEIAREAVRRAKRAERAEAEVRQAQRQRRRG